MRRSWVFSVVLAALVGVVGGVGVLPGGSGVVHACSCVESTDEAAFERASAVFVGSVTEVDRSAVSGASMDPVRYTVAVSGVYKGDVTAEQYVVTAVEGASCGTTLGSGDWLIFGRAVLAGNEVSSGDPDAEAGDVRTDLCSGTRAVAAAAVPASFGVAATPDTTPKTVAPVAQAEEDRTAGYVVMVGAVLAFVIGFAVLAVRFRKRSHSLGR